MARDTYNDGTTPYSQYEDLYPEKPAAKTPEKGSSPKRRPTFNHRISPLFHVQADYAVIGVFVLELLHQAKEDISLAIPFVVLAAILLVFFGAEEEDS